jgi:hypothetical protein
MEIGTQVILKNNPNPVEVIFEVEEEYDGRYTLRPIHDFPIPDGGFISKNNTREAKLEEFEEVWRFEISSGYDGYRNKVTGDWLYADDFYRLFSGEKQYTKEQIINAMHQVELEDNKDYSKLFYRVLNKL